MEMEMRVRIVVGIASRLRSCVNECETVCNCVKKWLK
jgi:hypothetical protein